MAEKKYIDVAALGIGKANKEIFNNPAYADGWNSVIQIIENAPAADVVKVVRCKKCSHYYGAACIHPRNVVPFRTEGNDYCSRGERKHYE